MPSSNSKQLFPKFTYAFNQPTAYEPLNHIVRILFLSFGLLTCRCIHHVSLGKKSGKTFSQGYWPKQKHWYSGYSNQNIFLHDTQYNCMRCFSFSSFTFLSRKEYSPSSKVSSMPITFNKVDLPEPEGPMMETNSPSLIERFISRRRNVLFPPLFTHL